MLRESITARVVNRIVRRLKQIAAEPLEAQKNSLKHIVAQGVKTRFGRNHDFGSIRDHKDFVDRVPLHSFRKISPYIDRIVAGEADVLWPGRPKYYGYSSGTTSQAKYIPIFKDFLLPYRQGARDALCNYMAETGNYSCVLGKLVYFTHNIEKEKLNNISVRHHISGIAHDNAPWLIKRRMIPSADTNRLVDYEEKINRSIEESLGKNITLVSGIPPWTQLYFNKLNECTGRPVKEIFPNLSVLVHGGVNIEPYRDNLQASLGGDIDFVEVYPATEGYIGYQASQAGPDLLLNLNGNIYYEFIPAGEIHKDNPTRLSLGEVELGVNYAVVLSNTGLWSYNLGDTIRFVSKEPYCFLITGRTSHYLSTTGEHLIAENVEGPLAAVSRETGFRVVEFTVAPQVDATSGQPFHEWFIEYDRQPTGLDHFAGKLNELVGETSINYREFIEAGILLPLKIKAIRRDGFNDYMKSIGKFGGQNKVPRLTNDRKIADALKQYVLS